MASALIRVEAVRACARYGAEYERAAISGLESLALLPLDDQVLERAAGLAPSDLRSLDALHLATALAIADDLGVVLCYDQRLAAAARGHGLAVASPA